MFLYELNTNWTLFLDRDGVLNHEKDGDYIRNVSEFIFYDGVLECFKKVSPLFFKIIIVTNQRGIGRGLMTHEDLALIHENMKIAIEQVGGRIDKIYYAPDLDNEAHDRKPNIGMGLKAKEKFPEIDFTQSIMVGNNVSDMAFGKRLGMKTVFVETTQFIDGEHELIDVKASSFPAFCAML
jgi:D-glycero-D-manno-heptose 1,7-bisphosphate phosphatase